VGVVELVGIDQAVPVSLLADPPGFIPRSVRVNVQGSKYSAIANTSVMYITVALCLGRNSPLHAQPLAFVSTTFAAGAVSRFDANVDEILTPTRPVGMNAEYQCRIDSTVAELTSRVMECSVWVGYATSNTSTTNVDKIYSVSAFEVWG
jgi:hypothetical protein